MTDRQRFGQKRGNLFYNYYFWCKYPNYVVIWTNYAEPLTFVGGFCYGICVTGRNQVIKGGKENG